MYDDTRRAARAPMARISLGAPGTLVTAVYDLDPDDALGGQGYARAARADSFAVGVRSTHPSPQRGQSRWSKRWVSSRRPTQPAVTTVCHCRPTIEPWAPTFTDSRGADPPAARRSRHAGRRRCAHLHRRHR